MFVGGLLLATVLTSASAPATARTAATAGALADVVVTGQDVSAVTEAVLAAGGEVTAELPLIGGVAARLPQGAHLPAGFVVAADRPLTFASAPVGAEAPTSTVRQTLGLAADGDEGEGVTVALVDTGVADVPDLAGRVVEHIDVTGTGGGDGYGHGTFLAGMIAGSGELSAGAYVGVAPGADILDVKVARQDGSTSLTYVLKGLQVVADRGPRHGVRVLNLSLSSGSPLPYQVDPLNQALRALWHRGVTVVVSSGNTGPGSGTVSSPGNDPLLLTVGGVDEAGTGARDDDSVAPWSGRGPTTQGHSKPELAAPGAHVIGLRSPGSVIDRTYPSARVGEHYLRGSGTSMSAAAASAAAAEVLAENPRLRPDEVKALLVDTAYRAPELSGAAGAGAGGLDLRAAQVAASSPGAGRGGPSVQQGDIPGDPRAWRALAHGIARGDQAAATRAWRSLDPEAQAWVGRSWAALDPTARSWAGRSWAGRSWANADGTAEQWVARAWAASWWAGDEWAGRSWAGRSWAGDDWAGRSWAGRSWAGDDWAGRSWAGDDWAGRSWASEDWSGRSWAATWR